jgi:hypothetical protein
MVAILCSVNLTFNREIVTIQKKDVINAARRGGPFHMKRPLRYYALQITIRLSPVQIVNFLCPIDEISVMGASIKHKKLTI